MAYTLRFDPITTEPSSTGMIFFSNHAGGRGHIWEILTAWTSSCSFPSFLFFPALPRCIANASDRAMWCYLVCILYAYHVYCILYIHFRWVIYILHIHLPVTLVDKYKQTSLLYFIGKHIAWKFTPKSLLSERSAGHLPLKLASFCSEEVEIVHKYCSDIIFYASYTLKNSAWFCFRCLCYTVVSQSETIKFTNFSAWNLQQLLLEALRF